MLAEPVVHFSSAPRRNLFGKTNVLLRFRLLCAGRFGNKCFWDRRESQHTNSTALSWLKNTSLTSICTILWISPLQSLLPHFTFDKKICIESRYGRFECMRMGSCYDRGFAKSQPLSEQSPWHLGHALPSQSYIRRSLFLSQNCLLSQDASSLIFHRCSPETEGKGTPCFLMIMDPNLT